MRTAERTTAPVHYSLLKSIKIARQTYGSVEICAREMVGIGHYLQADAIVNFQGAQHFGFWPWRFIRPIAMGDAIRIDNPETFDCEKLGGRFY